MAKTYISAAESNHNSDVNERRKNRANRRNPKCPIEGHHSVVCPPWMDGPYIKRCMAEWGCGWSMAKTIERIRREGR